MRISTITIRMVKKILVTIIKQIERTITIKNKNNDNNIDGK